MNAQTTVNLAMAYVEKGDRLALAAYRDALEEAGLDAATVIAQGELMMNLRAERCRAEEKTKRKGPAHYVFCYSGRTFIIRKIDNHRRFSWRIFEQKNGEDGPRLEISWTLDEAKTTIRQAVISGAWDNL